MSWPAKPIAALRVKNCEENSSSGVGLERHAFIGLWLQPIEFAALVTDNAAALRRRLEFEDLVVFETTLATQSSPASFSQAMAVARRQITENTDSNLEMAINVRRARMHKIRSLSATARAGLKRLKRKPGDFRRGMPKSRKLALYAADVTFFSAREMTLTALPSVARAISTRCWWWVKNRIWVF